MPVCGQVRDEFMKAVVFHKPGGPEQLKTAEFPVPQPGPGEITVRVRACALNHLDLWVLSGLPAYKINLPHALGCDIAGEVDELGEGVTGLKKGDRVVLYPVEACGKCEWCKAGQENRCAERTVIGAGPRWGGYSGVVRVPAGNAVAIPAALSFEDAASIPVSSLTAWHMLVTLAGLREGQTVMVMGVGGGVGAAALAIARAMKARVFATASRGDKREKAKTLGADAVLDHSEPHLAKRVRDLTGGRGVDVVVENIGPAVFQETIRSLAAGGTLVTCGATSGPEAPLELRYLFSRELTIRGAYIGPFSEFQQVVGAYGTGMLKPVIDSKFPAGDAAKALGRMLSRESFGKILLVH